MSEHHLEHAHRHFAASELDIADAYCQRVSALGNPAMSHVNDIGVLIQEALAHQANGTLEAQYEDAKRSCTAPSQTVLEIGCFAGYNLNAARVPFAGRTSPNPLRRDRAQRQSCGQGAGAVS